MASVINGITSSETGSGSSGSLSAFGEMSVAENVPYIQAAPVNNFLPANWRAYTDGSSGFAGVQDNQFKASTGTGGIGSYGAVQSFRALNYKPGEGGLARFTAVFENGGVASAWQGAGLVNVGDELSFGYNGVDFGCWHRHNGVAEVQSIQITGAAGGSENATINIDGTPYTVPLTSGSVQLNAHEVADYLNTNAAGWTASQNDDTVLVMASSDGDKTGTMSFSSGTATATMSEVTTGVTKTSDFVAQTSWNRDTASWIDPTKGNVYQITYQYLGYGSIKYWVENPSTGSFLLVHEIEWANNNTSPSLGNPSMHGGWYATSIGTATDVVVRGASFLGASQGPQVKTRNPRAVDNEQTGVGTTLTNILSVRNKRVVNGKLNQQEIEPIMVSLSNESGSKAATFRILGNPTFGAATNFQNTGSSNLISEYDVTDTDVSGGRELAAFIVGGGDSKEIDISSLQIRVPPTLTLCICAKSNSGGSGLALNAAITFYEDV